MKILVKPRFQPERKLSLEEVNQRVASGEFDGSEQAKLVGSDDWTVLCSIEGVMIDLPSTQRKGVSNVSDTQSVVSDEPNSSAVSALESIANNKINDQIKKQQQKKKKTDPNRQNPQAKLSLFQKIVVIVGWLLVGIQAFASLGYWKFVDESTLILQLANNLGDPNALGAVIGTIIGANLSLILTLILTVAFLRRAVNVGKPLIIGSILVFTFTVSGIFLPARNSGEDLSLLSSPATGISEQEEAEEITNAPDPEEGSLEYYLFWGLFNDDNLAVQKVLKAGANPNARSGGDHALFVAATRGDTMSIRLLLDAGALIDLKTRIAERTALHQAVLKSKIDVMKMLIYRGADVNAKNKFGRTPLYYATNPSFPLPTPADSEFLIKYLKEHGGEL